MHQRADLAFRFATKLKKLHRFEAISISQMQAPESIINMGNNCTMKDIQRLFSPIFPFTASIEYIRKEKRIGFSLQTMNIDEISLSLPLLSLSPSIETFFFFFNLGEEGRNGDWKIMTEQEMRRNFLADYWISFQFSLLL